MDLTTVLFIAVGLSMDAFAVSVSAGMVVQRISIRHGFRASFSFGSWQFLMPVLGWLAGSTVEDAIASYDHWVAFALLSFVAARMIWGSFHPGDGDGRAVDITKAVPLLALSIATSIDALAVGLSLAFLRTEIVYPSLVIGVVTFLISATGLYIGKRVSRLLENGLERGIGLLGGLILLGIGTKILVEHLFS